MTLGTHAVAGAFVGVACAHNIPLAIVASFASHFLLDAIPHWDYAILSLQKDTSNPLNNDMGANRNLFYKDLMRTGLDAGIGMGVVLLLFSQAPIYIFMIAILGACFAVLPDALQFLYWKFRHEPLVSLQRFHLYMHAKSDLNTEPIIGVLSQVFVVLICVVLSSYLFL